VPAEPRPQFPLLNLFGNGARHPLKLDATVDVSQELVLRCLPTGRIASIRLPSGERLLRRIPTRTEKNYHRRCQEQGGRTGVAAIPSEPKPELLPGKLEPWVRHLKCEFSGCQALSELVQHADGRMCLSDALSKPLPRVTLPGLLNIKGRVNDARAVTMSFVTRARRNSMLLTSNAPSSVCSMAADIRTVQLLSSGQELRVRCRNDGKASPFLGVP